MKSADFDDLSRLRVLLKVFLLQKSFLRSKSSFDKRAKEQLRTPWPGLVTCYDNYGNPHTLGQYPTSRSQIYVVIARSDDG